MEMNQNQNQKLEDFIRNAGKEPMKLPERKAKFLSGYTFPTGPAQKCQIESPTQPARTENLHV